MEIFCDTAPRTSFNFLALAASGCYNNTKFHRNIRGFIVQGGDPTGTGKGGDSIWDGTFPDEFDPENTHDKRGMVSMANKGKPNTNKSQFFITYERQPHLNNVNTVFGKILNGWDVLDAMERQPMMPNDKKNRPVDPNIIVNITIHANPLADENIIYPTKNGPPEKVN